MGLISITLPTIGDPNTTEDVDVRNALSTIQTVINGNIDSANIAANAVGTSQLAALGVTSAKLAAGAVISGKININGNTRWAVGNVAVAAGPGSTVANHGMGVQVAFAVCTVNGLGSGGNIAVNYDVPNATQIRIYNPSTSPLTVTYLCFGP